MESSALVYFLASVSNVVSRQRALDVVIAYFTAGTLPDWMEWEGC